MADELHMRVFQHQALFDTHTHDEHNDEVSPIARPS